MCHSPLRQECPPDPFVSVRHPERQNSSSAQLLRKTSFFGGKKTFKSADKFGKHLPPPNPSNRCLVAPFPPPTDNNFREITRGRFSPRCLRCNKSNLLGCTSCCCCGARLVRSTIRSLLQSGSCSLLHVSVITTKHPRLIIKTFNPFSLFKLAWRANYIYFFSFSIGH